ncbi:hypothetical protein N7468_007123 [Penicillium chermesinum]|uniref:DUF202 domain-containing protein n=1 Tax=Penicillium chermesinum TaxID=63820 RepID=A0A9W9NTV8_9EURO|nr:uncharacterized protein N7468_007123 [Penicillium chermesinum]KAJ5225898.1 hypothetical protein N7468_007123 [Penicillium chermesinum]KAJ6160896.1 hypothetical protein N7470_004292 [Penicillium chermesinum]
MASLIRRLIPARITNNGSQQRDHHANERTFLSWTRAGLGFAAMAVALDRLDAIDRVLNQKLGLGSPGPLLPNQHVQPGPIRHGPAQGKTSAAAPSAAESQAPSGLQNQISMAHVCQLLGVWSLGYGFFRYWSMRRYLLMGQFVPAFWGPVLMTTGSFVAFMAMGLQMDRRHATAS